MGLNKKTFLYSMIISLIMVALVVGYFTLMLPSLYVDHMEKSNYESIIAVHKGYIKDKSYDNLPVKNPTGSLTLEIPGQGDTLHITGKFFKSDVTIKDEKLREVIDEIRYYLSDYERLDELSEESIDLSLIKEKLLPEDILKDYPLEFNFSGKDAQDSFKEGSSKVHRVSDSLMVFETSTQDEGNNYTSYIAMGKGDDSFIISLLPIMTPQIDEIRPVILGSLPMIAAVVFLLVLIFSKVFSNGIVNPIIDLATYADSVKESNNLELEPLNIEGKDEIAQLGRNLNELYERLRENYKELERKNRALSEENKRQEVFLRASSHQLKTPITAALLLIEGMINEIGKYKNTKEYLPKVKEQLQSMRRIVDDILYLNHCADNLKIEAVDLREILQKSLESYNIQIKDKGLSVKIQGAMGYIETDREILKKIIDNLLCNAVSYTPKGETIEIIFKERQLYLRNYGAYIEEELLQHIYEPFVSGSSKEKGHGLGLYIASYYGKLLDCEIKVDNFSGGVQAELIFN